MLERKIKVVVVVQTKCEMELLVKLAVDSDKEILVL